MWMTVLDVKTTHERNPNCLMRLAQDADGRWFCADCGHALMWKRLNVSETPTMGTDREYIPKPDGMSVFVFGSNLAGVHGAGAAQTAYEKYGAIWGNGVGHQSSTDGSHSYAIPTKDRELRTLPLGAIQEYVDKFVIHTRHFNELTFFVTRIGCGLAGYTDAQIAPLFKYAPENCELPNGWREHNDAH